MKEKNRVIADTIHGNISLTYYETKIYSHVNFNRLHDVYQNSTAYLTFPCNRTKRFEHSLGTMKLCSDIFISGIKNANDEIVDEFLEIYSNEILSIIDKIKDGDEYSQKFGGRKTNIKKSIPSGISQGLEKLGLRDNIMPPHKDTYFILLQAIRAAALLHDIGHPPYSHVVESALMDIWKEFSNSGTSENVRIRKFIEIMGSFFSESMEEKRTPELHEQMGKKIAKIILEDAINNVSIEDAEAGDYNIENQVFGVLINEIVQKIYEDKKPFDVLHRIIDGTLDGDRLDYVTRDVLNSGLDKGKIEYDRLFNGITIAKDKEQFWFCPSIKSLNTVEDFLNRRWDEYKNILFHHRVIKTDHLLKNIIKKISISYLRYEIDQGADSDDSDLLPADISGLWKALRRKTNVESSYAISQWDDAWLMTILKKYYFNYYIGNKSNIIMQKQLAELLTNRKYYFSVIKRLEDFLIIDHAISKYLSNNNDTIYDKISKLRILSNSIDQNENEFKKIDIEPFLTRIEEILYLSKKAIENKYFQGLIFSYLKKSDFQNLEEVKTTVSKLIVEAIDCLPPKSVEDVFCEFRFYKSGVDQPLFFYNDNINKLQPVHEISSISKILTLNIDTFPQFFIYILKTKEDKDDVLDINNFLEVIGKKIGENFYQQWMKILEENIYKYEELSRI